MDAVIRVSSSEFNEDLFKKIKALVSSFGNAEITIAVNDRMVNNIRSESKDEYWDRLNKSVADIKAGKGVVFTMEEFTDYVNKAEDK